MGWGTLLTSDLDLVLSLLLFFKQEIHIVPHLNWTRSNGPLLDPEFVIAH